MISPTHREEHVKSIAPEKDIQFARHHRPGYGRVGNKKHMLVWCADEFDLVQGAYRTVRAVTACDPFRLDLTRRAVRLLERGRYLLGALREGDKLGAPLHVHPPRSQGFFEQPLVIVLTQDENKGVWTQIASDVTERYTCSSSPLDPHVRGSSTHAQLERTLDNSEMRVDLKGACLHA